VELTATAGVRGPEDVPDGAAFAVAHSARVASPPDAEGVFFVHALIEARLQSATPEGEVPREPLVLVKGVFELCYRLPKGQTTTEDGLAEFASVNAVFNAWPYFRELVQSTMARMSLPPLTLPLYRIPRTQAVVDTASADTAKIATRTQRASRRN
jgi:preprotein translocase subunit SecB